MDMKLEVLVVPVSDVDRAEGPVTIGGGVGHNLAQETQQAFVNAIVEVNA